MLRYYPQGKCYSAGKYYRCNIAEEKYYYADYRWLPKDHTIYQRCTGGAGGPLEATDPLYPLVR